MGCAQRQVDQKETALQESRRLATAKEQVRGRGVPELGS
jgi:hypothetical protein